MPTAVTYLALSLTSGCGNGGSSPIAAAREARMSKAMLGELMAVVDMANKTNRWTNGYRVEVDRQFKQVR